MNKLNGLILAAATVGGALLFSGAAMADNSCTSVSDIGKSFPINIKNSSKDPIWYTIYSSPSRDGKKDYGCVMPGTSTVTGNNYSCGGGGYYVLGEQKKGNNNNHKDCGGDNYSEPMTNLVVPSSNQGQITYSNSGTGYALSISTAYK